MTEILGLAELAALLNIAPDAAGARLRRGRLPEPDWRLACGPIWRKARIEQWISKQESKIGRAR